MENIPAEMKKEELPMSVMDGCESQHRTSVIEEKVCPKCGKEVEVFTSRESLQRILYATADMYLKQKMQFR